MRTLLALLMLVMVVGVVGATDEPTTTPTPTPPAPTATPPILPTPIFIPDDQIYDAIEEADDRVGELPPASDDLLPNPDLERIFGYMKWLIAPDTAEQLAGPFQGVITHMGIYFIVRFVLFGVYALVFVIVYIVRWIVWLVRLVISLIEVVVRVVEAVNPIGLLFRFLRGG